MTRRFLRFTFRFLLMNQLTGPNVPQCGAFRCAALLAAAFFARFRGVARGRDERNAFVRLLRGKQLSGNAQPFSNRIVTHRNASQREVACNFGNLRAPFRLRIISVASDRHADD